MPVKGARRKKGKTKQAVAKTTPESGQDWTFPESQRACVGRQTENEWGSWLLEIVGAASTTPLAKGQVEIDLLCI